MVCLYLFRGSWMAALTVILMVLSPPLAWARQTQHKCCLLSEHCVHQFKAHLTVQGKSEGHFSILTEQVRFLARYFYNQKELVHFDSNDVGEFRAVTELGRLFAESWNHQKDFVEWTRAVLDTVCRHLVRASRNVQGLGPRVTVYPAKTQPLQHRSLLVCSVNGFYPGHVEVRWFRNSHEKEAGLIATGLISNRDWTFQTVVMLETVPQSGEVYTCRVEHPRRSSPITVEWSEKLSDLISSSATKAGACLSLSVRRPLSLRHVFICS
uniref:Ig-like domain-containing protein n=1 Tax=Moschus moschiferus TaxID=68415 RepID=A0A8C6D2L1_MOSMO